MSRGVTVPVQATFVSVVSAVAYTNGPIQLYYIKLIFLNINEFV